MTSTLKSGSSAHLQAGALRRFVATPSFFLLVIIFVLVIVLGSIKPAFFNGPFVIAPLLTGISIFTVVGLSQMVVLSIGHMNLAVGPMAAFGAMFMGLSYELWDLPLVLGLALGILAGAAMGALSGWLVARTGVNSFIVTLAMSFALIGLVPTVYSWLSAGSAFTVKPDGLDEIGRSSFSAICVNGACGSNAIPLIVIPALGVMLLIGYLYSHTRLGRELLMTGSNVDAAQLSGIPTGRRIVLVHSLSGALAALAGFLLAASTGSFTPGIGQEFMLQSFVGPILGGTLLAGGYVSVTGTLLGITLTLVIRKGLDLFGVGLETLNVLLGVILLIALSSDQIRLFFGRRRTRRPAQVDRTSPPPGPKLAQPSVPEEISA
ncbi:MULTISPECIES: ABC transporter permease [Cryobacterium]|uniref:ABC transporter permease n=1 Tax=Cryobacterium breve TaxID=1259258 RepID=A0ABY2J0F3_9MICO|nr:MULTISPECIES: ABC transporter permease [Cryobacterium]TFC91779.1 ABC transporter permease [Cryobacterium sp. TmT3-12]TFC98329.1 ABC transporter permease [Cryobacterium breve]